MLEHVPSLSELQMLVRLLPSITTLWIVLKKVGEERALLNEVLRVAMPGLKVVCSAEKVDLWKGMPGMSSPSHKVIIYVLVARWLDEIARVTLIPPCDGFSLQLPYEWEEARGCW
jgi:hypothetical protein